MPAVTSQIDFLELVRKSGLIERDKLDAYLADLAARGESTSDPKQTAVRMIKDGLLTTFHCKQLLLGKWRGFFLLDKYKVINILGAGASGRVYLCQQTRLNRLVAVKILPSQNTQSSDAVERFYREARAVASLNHPNIVRVFDIDHDGRLHFMVLEYVDGSSLQDLIMRHGRLDCTRAGHYIRQAAAGLHHAHEHGWIHRDIKPGNILLDRLGVVKILDLGLARFLQGPQDNLTILHQGQSVLGTVDYISPEQAMSSHQVDIRADIYSLGATFRYLITGQTPFPEGSITNKLLWHQLREPQPIEQLRPDVPPEFVAIINKMMAKNPAHRFQTPGEVMAALMPYTSGLIPAPPESEMPKRLQVFGGITVGPSSSMMGHDTPSSTDIQSLVASSITFTGGIRSPGPLSGGSGGSMSGPKSGGSILDDISTMRWRGASLVAEDDGDETAAAVKPGSFAFIKQRFLALTKGVPMWVVWTVLGSGWLIAMGMILVIALVMFSNPTATPATKDNTKKASVLPATDAIVPAMPKGSAPA